MRSGTNPTIGALLALLGGVLVPLGLHKFYQRKYCLGVIYIVFWWTFVPQFVSLAEAAMMWGWSARENSLSAQ